ncbi:MAG: rhodanese-like domain-containing protein [Bacteroidota bacterium]
MTLHLITQLRKITLEVVTIGVLSLFLATIVHALRWEEVKGTIQARAEGYVKLQDILGRTDILWLDAREVDDYEQEHIPGALLLNETSWDELIAQVFEAWQPDMRIVVYCSSAGCNASAKVAERLREDGLSNVFVLKEGWEAWKEKHP